MSGWPPTHRGPSSLGTKEGRQVRQDSEVPDSLFPTESPAAQYKSFLICTGRSTAWGKVVLWSGSAGYLLPNRAKPSLRLDKNCRDVEASCRCTRQSVRGANRLRPPLETSGVCVSASPEISSVRLRLPLSRDLRAPGLDTPWRADAHPPRPYVF